MTKKYKKCYITCKVFSILLTILPILIYTVIGFVEGSVGAKVSLGMCLMTTLIFVTINVIFKHRIRCTIWIMLIGICACVSNVIPLLIIMAVTVALDEFLLEPLSAHYKSKYIINQEIDKRQE